MARGSFSSSPLDGGAPPFEIPGTSRVTDAPPAGESGTTLALGAVAPVGGGRAVPVDGGGTVAGESNSQPEDPGDTPTTGARPPLGAGRTSMLAESQRWGLGAHPLPLNGQRPDGELPFGPPRVEAVGSSPGIAAGGTPAGLGSNRTPDALSLVEEEQERREFQRAFGVTPEDVARAQWRRATRDHWSIDATSKAGGTGPSLHGVGGVAAQGGTRPAADTGHLQHLAKALRDAAEEVSNAASEGTPVPERSAAVAMALAAAQGPSPAATSAGAPAPPGPGSGTSGKRPPAGCLGMTGTALTVTASRAARPAQSQRGRRRRRRAQWDGSAPPSEPPSSTESEQGPSDASSDPSEADATDSSDGSNSSSATGSDPGATQSQRRARAADKRPQRALVRKALRAFRREQREDTSSTPASRGSCSRSATGLRSEGAACISREANPSAAYARTSRP